MLNPELERRYRESLSFLFDRINYEKQPQLMEHVEAFPRQRMKRLLELVDNPHEQIRCVHIAGTKGKGSTAVMISQILREAGYRVGLFTSPHAYRFEERMKVDGKMPLATELTEIIDRLRTAVDVMDAESTGQPTFFELATAVGWLYFFKRQVEIAVIEVGLGGRLDSTNFCNPLVTLVTSISLDHTRLLGASEEQITAEKAGIFKPDIPALIGMTDPRLVNVAEQIAAKTGSPLFKLGEDFTLSNLRPGSATNSRLIPFCFDYHENQFDFTSVKLQMPGRHQAQNAALAIAACRHLQRQGWSIDDSAIRTGLRDAVMPLRIEVLNQHPLFIVDAAHNIASIAALCETLSDLEAAQRICIFSASRDKDWREMFGQLDSVFDRIVLTEFQQTPRAVPLSHLKDHCETVCPDKLSAAPTPAKAVRIALESAQPADLICATGSLFLAAEIKAEFLAIRG